MNDVKEWEKQEADRKAKALEQVLLFKDMRESQVKDKAARLQRVCPAYCVHLSCHRKTWDELSVSHVLLLLC